MNITHIMLRRRSILTAVFISVVNRSFFMRLLEDVAISVLKYATPHQSHIMLIWNNLSYTKKLSTLLRIKHSTLYHRRNYKGNIIGIGVPLFDCRLSCPRLVFLLNLDRVSNSVKVVVEQISLCWL